MKKVSLTVFFLFVSQVLLFARSEFRSIEATSSSQNPGVVKVKTNYKSVDDQGHEKTSSLTKNFTTKDGSSYIIRLDDDGSDVFFEETTPQRSYNGSNVFQDDNFPHPYTKTSNDFFDDFFNFHIKQKSQFDKMVDEFFKPDNAKNPNYNKRQSKPEKAKIAPPKIKQEKIDNKKQYTPEQKQVLEYIDQLKKEYNL